MVETLEEYLVMQVRGKQQELVRVAIRSWDESIGSLPSFRQFLIVNIESLWLEWVKRN